VLLSLLTFFNLTSFLHYTFFYRFPLLSLNHCSLSSSNLSCLPSFLVDLPYFLLSSYFHGSFLSSLLPFNLIF
jgi:hypothetical protein